MSREDIKQYLMETLYFDGFADQGAVDYFDSWDMGYFLYTSRGDHGIYLEFGLNNEDRDGVATTIIPPEKISEQSILDFFRHHGYPPAMRLHRLAILSLLQDTEDDQT